jgi:hypothetical protein
MVTAEGSVDVGSYLQKQWHLEVVTDFSGSVRTGVCQRHRVEKLDRTDTRPEIADDFRWIVSFSELYPQGFTVDEAALFPEISIPACEIYTLCRTVPLNHSRGGRPLGLFGGMADITGVDITLPAGDRLVLRTDDGQSILNPPIGFEAGTTRYIAFLNLPPDHMIGIEDAGAPTHFQDYYLLIPKRFDDRYDFQLGTTTPASCKMAEGLSRLLPKGKGEKRIFTPPPYFCGTAGG